jgi:hypothetical protein
MPSIHLRYLLPEGQYAYLRLSSSYTNKLEAVWEVSKILSRQHQLPRLYYLALPVSDECGKCDNLFLPVNRVLALGNITDTLSTIVVWIDVLLSHLKSGQTARALSKLRCRIHGQTSLRNLSDYVMRVSPTVTLKYYLSSSSRYLTIRDGYYDTLYDMMHAVCRQLAVITGMDRLYFLCLPLFCHSHSIELKESYVSFHDQTLTLGSAHLSRKTLLKNLSNLRGNGINRLTQLVQDCLPARCRPQEFLDLVESMDTRVKVITKLPDGSESHISIAIDSRQTGLELVESLSKELHRETGVSTTYFRLLPVWIESDTAGRVLNLAQLLPTITSKHRILLGCNNIQQDIVSWIDEQIGLDITTTQHRLLELVKTLLGLVPITLADAALYNCLGAAAVSANAFCHYLI